MDPRYTYIKDFADCMDPEDFKHARITMHPASVESVKTVLEGDTESGDGRSPFMWIRFPNGDLILGVYPRGETYLAVEDDADFKFD